MAVVRIGKIDRRLAILGRTVTQGGMGGQIEGWDTIASVWGQKVDLAGREYVAAQQNNSELTTMFRIRWRDDVHADMRLICEGKEYDIKSVSELGRRQWLEIQAVAPDSGAQIDFEE